MVNDPVHARPLTPGGALLVRRWPLVVVGIAFVGLSIAVLAGGVVDPVDRLIRRPDGDDGDLRLVFRVLTELGGGPVAIPLSALAAAVAWRRSPPLGAAIVLAVAARYGIEALLKEAIGRERPASLRLVEADGSSFPSGHVLGATVAWGAVPAAVRTLTGRTAPWRVAVAAWITAVTAVAASRVYLGVHWFTDTVGSLLVGLLLLALVDVAGGLTGSARGPR